MGGGGGDKHHHHHLLPRFHSWRKEEEERRAMLPPKGSLAIQVGGEAEDRQRVVVPVVYLSHPLFLGLLKEAEEEYGFDHKGAITIPCHLDYFRQIQEIIDREKVGSYYHRHHHQGHHHHHHHHHHHLLAGCFRA